MDIFLFVSELGLSAFTSDRTGSNLPGVYAPWQPDADWPSRSIDEVVSAIAIAVTQRGFFVISNNRLRRRPTDRGAKG